jgi:glucokinase
MSAELAVGVDLGGTTVRVALVDPEGQLKYDRAYASQVDRGPYPVIDDMAAWIQEAIDAIGVSRDELVGVGIGSPGPLSARQGIVYKAANLPGWVDVPLRQAMQERTGLPVVIDNDGNLAAYGEYWAGAGRGSDDMVMLTLGTGVGAGVVIEGEIFHGHFENAAELGHMIVVPNGRLCTCGQRGCLEQYASAGNVGKRLEEAVRDGETSILAGPVEKGEDIGSKEVVIAAREGDELAARIWDEACFFLAVACVNIQHAFNPERIVMAGGMSKAGAFLTDLVRNHFELLTWQLCDDVPDIRIAILGDDAGVIGAAGWAWKAERQHRWPEEVVDR